ncbi:CHRD domain-containing protein [soil metagenome]
MSRLASARLILALIVLALAAGPVSAASDRNFVAPLSGGEEVPAVDTNATGVATFKLSADGSSLSYRLIAANIQDTLQAHIHIGAAGTNGGVVVFLYPDAPPAQLIPGRFQGVLATGTITAANFVGALAGEPLEVLLAHMREGNAYVNVHTSAHQGGEIRGQIR